MKPEKNNLSIHGVLPPMITPFTEHGDVDYDAFEHNMERWNAAPLSGYLVLGSNSETPLLTPEEKLRLIRTTVETAKEGRIILAGTGLESTRETIFLTNKAAAVGVHAALVLTPAFYKDQMTDRVMIRHFTEVAENSQIPILIYNVPKFTGITISATAAKELGQHPNIIGMKDSSGSLPQLTSYLSVVPADFNLIVGTAALWYPALTLGIRAGILALANCAPEECVAVQKYVDAANHAAARELYLKLLPLNAAITATYGIAGLKYACSANGCDGGFVRPPLLPLTDTDKRAIDAILKSTPCVKF
ncbi:MAG: dihydrodipicolinate synthase family protein [Ignavibacteriales bacterium]|nr:dihydrodipicolinate synthase family protein [Ignavibacteriales bacterium]